MSTITDPARELADICAALTTGHDKKGAAVLAATFDVEQWSAEFYQIVFTILQRIDELKGYVDALEMDSDIRDHAKNHLEQIALVFTPTGLSNNWANALQSYLSAANVGPVRMLSAQVRQIHSYPKLDSEEAAEILDLVETLIEWLDAHQLVEADFIRQAIIDGLRNFAFRLERVRWLGWGYTLESLREVIGAYMALERGMAGVNENPDAAAALAKIKGLLKVFFDKVKFAQDFTSASDFILKAYGATTLLIQGKQSVAGFLSHMPG